MHRADEASTTERRRRLIVALSPFLIAIPTLIVVVQLYRSLLPEKVIGTPTAIFGGILAFDLIVCVFVLVKWLRTGEPPKLSLSPLLRTRKDHECRRDLRQRRQLNDAEFYEVFYAHWGIPRHIPGQLRKQLEDAMGFNFAGLWPCDNLVEADGEPDWADVFYRMERVFKVPIPRERWDEFDGTFDSLLKLIVARTD
jgi:hypothetical protein